MKIRTVCNPVNINYQYQAPMLSRESADPAVILYRDEYYLFASHGSGYWVSEDLANWEFIEVDVKSQPEFDLYAPGPVVVGDRIYLTHSQGGCILYSDNPRDPNSWVNVGRPFIWNDPSLFVDDDGSFYVFEGLSPFTPLHAAKLNPDNFEEILEGPVDIFQCDRESRGFERIGDVNERDGGLTHLEGPWVNKIDGKYYLTYAVPGTEYAGYCDGCAVADSPLGPYTFCENSPVIYKATGFMRGAGHGCLFADKKGNYWKMDTVSISINHIFERRLCLFPAKVENRLIYTNTYRGDYPKLLPHDTDAPFSRWDAGWHLLSLHKTAKASSTLDESHSPDKAFDESLRTWWSAQTGNPGEWLWTDLGKVYDVCAIQINFADQNIAPVHGRGHGFAYRYTLEASMDGEKWFLLIDKRDSTEDLSHDYTQLDEATKFRYLKLTNCGDTPAGGKFSISGLRVFGLGGGNAPEKAPDFTVLRGEDSRNMTVSWPAAEDAQGYLIRWGIDPHNLHTHWQVIGDCKATVYCLTKEISYYVTVDAYNESGITYGTDIKQI
ncbi:MAG: carbohydrate-binding protein [Ruminococcaceae bacterium]|nr:carbohydrate-binding protein [Oscillospiraceae bacterium]